MTYQSHSPPYNRSYIKNLRELLKQYNKITTALQSDKVRQDLTRLTSLTQALSKVQSEIEANIELLDTENRLLLEETIRDNKELFSELLNNFKTPRKDLKQKMKLIEEVLGDGKLDITGYIRFYIKTTQDGVEVLSEDAFDLDELSDDVVHNLEATAPYMYYGSSKSGIVYLEPLIHDYNELPQIDYDVLIDEVFKKHPSVAMIKLKMDGSIKTLTLSEIMSRMQVYLNKPIKVKGTLLSINTTAKNVLFRFKAIKGSGMNAEEFIIYNIPYQEKAILETSTLKIKHNDEENISQSIIEFEITDSNTQIKAITLSDYLKLLLENLGAELEFWGIIYPKIRSTSSTEQEYVFWVTDIKTAEEEAYKLPDERIEEIEKFLKKFKDGRELLDWMMDNYAQRIRYTEQGDFTWRMKLTHLILAQNSWLGNKEMLHALLLSRPGKGKTTLAIYYLPLVARRVKYADRSRMTVPGLLGGFDQQTKETRVGVIKSADRGVMVIDEADKFANVEKNVIMALNLVLQHGRVSITLGNQSRSIEYNSRPNFILLGNYNAEELEELIKYYDDEATINKEKEDFISKEMLKITEHLSTLDRFIILDSDIFEFKEETEEEVIQELEQLIDSKKESESLEPTPSEILKLRLIRDIMIYNTQRIDREKLIESVKPYLKNIARFILEKRINQEKNRLMGNIINLIATIATLKGEQEVTRDTVDLALMLAGISRKYKQIWKTKKEKLKQIVEEFFEEEVIREIPVSGLEEDSIRRKFREALRGYTEQEKKELMKLFDSKLADSTSSGVLKKEGTTIKVGQKRLSEALKRLVEDWEHLAVRKRCPTKVLYDIVGLSKELGVSTDIIVLLLKEISRTSEIKRTTIREDGTTKTVYEVDVDAERLVEIQNSRNYNQVTLKLFI